MGFDLKPKNLDLGCFYTGSFSWYWMLENGVGLPIGCGKDLTSHDESGFSSFSNDGFEVAKEEAEQMGLIAGFVADYQTQLWENVKNLPEDQRKKYNIVRRDFVEKTKNFGEWAKQSNGFTVH